MEDNELKYKLEQELQWIQYRMRILDIIETKLIQMREIAEIIKNGNLNSTENEELTAKLNNLASQVNALDGESKKVE